MQPKANDLPVVRFLREQPKSKQAQDFHEADGAALLSNFPKHPWGGMVARHAAKKLFKAAIAEHPERAYFVAETCELAGAHAMARNYYEKATQQPLTAPHAWHRLGLMREQQANHSIGAWFTRRNSKARAAFAHAVELNVSAGHVERFECWTDRFTHAWLGVSCYAYLHHKHNPLHLHHHFDALAFKEAARCFAAALPLRPESVLAQMDVLLQSPHCFDEAQHVQEQIIAPLNHYVRSDAVYGSETMWILAQRVLRLALHAAACPSLHPPLRALLDAVREGPLGDHSCDSHSLAAIKQMLALPATRPGAKQPSADAPTLA